MTIHRRNFLKNTAAGALATVTPHWVFAGGAGAANADGKGTIFLFQGDSITDGNRSRNNDWNHVMGHGYAYLVASRIWYEFPEKDFNFFNRGISGNKLPDLHARWEIDTITIKPDVLSILIGINDVSEFINGKQSFNAGNYENDYRTLLKQTKERLPNVQLVICEPFILPVGKVKDLYDHYLNEIKLRQQIAKQLAGEFAGIFIGFQAAFDKALNKAPAEYWIWDGIHPMPAGHELMARTWIETVGKRLKYIR